MNNKQKSTALMIIPPPKCYLVEPKFKIKKGEKKCVYCGCIKENNLKTTFDDDIFWCNCWHTKDGMVVLLEL